MSDISASYYGYNLFTKSLDNLPKLQKVVVNTINQYSFCMAEKEPEFKRALLESGVLLPDGVGIVAAVRLMSGQKIKKISGFNFHNHLLDKLNQEGGSCFYLGSTEKTLKKIQEKIAVEYPNIKVGCYSPPFKASFSDSDNASMIAKVNKFKPDVLFVGMTAPKQEKWVTKHKDELNAKIIGSIGAVFDFYAGTMNRPSNFWISLGFEWFGRLLNEPVRMWKRYLYYGPVFLFIIFKDTLRHHVSRSISIADKKVI